MRFSTRSRRRTLLVLPALIAAGAVSALLALGALGGGGEALADSHPMGSGHATVTARQLTLRQDMRAFDRVHVQALGMADMLSAGIISQFPGRFR
jgi:hypothetical protein